MTRPKLNFDRAASEGMTLVELLVATVVGLIVVLAAGGLLGAGLRAQNTVGSAANVTRAATAINDSLTTGIGNALKMSLNAGAASGDQIVRTKTLNASGAGTQTWACNAWYYQASTQSLYTFSNTTGTIATPTTTGLRTWHLLGSNIQLTPANTTPASNVPIFAGPSTSGSGTAVPLTVTFTAVDGAVRQDAYSNQITPNPVPTPTANPGASLTCT